MTAEPPTLFSFATAASQSARLVEKLEEYQFGDFPPETQLVAKLLEAFARVVEQELSRVADVVDHTAANRERVRRLSEMVHNIYSCLRYLDATETRRTPPYIQTLLSALVAQHLPDSKRDPIVLVHPQWDYNFEFYDLSAMVRSLIRSEIIDPDDRLRLLSPLTEIDADAYAEAFLDVAWERLKPQASSQALDGARPGEIAVLSFAGLDTDDVLQIPILAHELGHFIDYHGGDPQHLQPQFDEFFFKSFDQLELALHPVEYEQADIERFFQIVNFLIDTAFREILADLIAVRMLGLGFFLSLADLLHRLLERDALRVTDSGYLEIGYRLKLSFDELENIGTIDFLATHARSPSIGRTIALPLADHLDSLGQWSEPRPKLLDRVEDWPPRLNQLAADAVERALPRLRNLATSLVPPERAAALGATFFDRVLAIEDGLPPAVYADTAHAYSEILSAAWAYEILFRGSANHKERSALTSRLVLKSLELASAPAALEDTRHEKPLGSARPSTRHGALAGYDIIERLGRRAQEPGRLVIVPLRSEAIQGASVDVRLGNWFKIARRPRLPVVDLRTIKRQFYANQVGHEEVFLPFGKQLTIHPGDFILAITLEFFSLPADLMAFVEGRSLLGRAGLGVATASTIAPGFTGGVVLELSNTGVVPLQISPGLDVAQVVFLTLTSDAPPYAGSSRGQIRP